MFGLFDDNVRISRSAIENVSNMMRRQFAFTENILRFVSSMAEEGHECEEKSLDDRIQEKNTIPHASKYAHREP